MEILERTEAIHQQVLKFKDFWNGLLNEKVRATKILNTTVSSKLEATGITPQKVKDLEERINKGCKAMYQKSLELKELGYALTGNGEGIEPWNEAKAHTVHGVYGFITQHETVYEFAARNAANDPRTKRVSK